MKFTLEIELGNDAAQSGEDVSEILRQLATRMSLRNWGKLVAGERMPVLDINDNPVGKWEVKG